MRRALAALALLAVACTGGDDDDRAAPGRSSSSTGATTTTAARRPATIWSSPQSTSRPYSETVPGVLTFRGNPSRTYYGRGPVPRQPSVQWRYPENRLMCGFSTVGSETTEWCGTGWTGQPAVFEREGRTLVAFGAYDKAVHLVDAATGEPAAPPFPTGDIIKGSVTVDPDGYPLIYTGSRDDHYRVLSFAGAHFVELWRLSANAVSPVKWNDDWDGSGLIIGDHLLEGGENGQFHVAKLNRAHTAGGGATVRPELVFNTPGWDDQLLIDLPDNNVSIESSVALWGSTAYFVNSGGLVQGWDLAPLDRGEAPRQTFRFWVGDDADATVVVDTNGFLYVAVEWDRRTARAREIGQLVKLDPRRPDDPVVWSVDDQTADRAGFWATPALYRDLVLAPTDGGRLLAIDRETGAVRWELRMPGPLWSSPAVVDGVLVQGDCEGVLHGFDLSDLSTAPPELWRVELDGCIESTPAVWKGRIYVGTRGGHVFAVG